jgi:hypothetical protein
VRLVPSAVSVGGFWQESLYLTQMAVTISSQAATYSYQSKFLRNNAVGAKVLLNHLEKLANKEVMTRSGRGDWIRTNGLLVPNQARYQAALRPD